MNAVLPFILLALVLGFKHSYDADHLIAVSNLLRKSSSVKASTKLGLSWAVGHMLTATIITLILYFFKETFLSSILPSFEKIVGFMIILLGLYSLKEAFFPDSNIQIPKRFKEPKNEHKYMLGVGIIHGLASNDELIILLTASLGVNSLNGIIIGLGMFSIGVILGMILFSVIFSYPLIKSKDELFLRAISLITGLLGILYGFFMLI